LEAAARFVYVKRGARGDAFTPIVASGPNTMIVHYTKNSRQMKDGDVVLMDYGADFDYYTSDVTRTWAVSGKFTPEQEKMYRCVLDARNAIIAAMKPGVKVTDLQAVAQQVYKKHGFEKEFVQFGRYVGHFVGISVHDVGRNDQPFVPGVTFNVEPIMQDEKLQIHMRLEDTILITNTGAENMTAGVPTELEELYALQRQKPLTINE
jgi:Xaa-Pro aminopeptidase